MWLRGEGAALAACSLSLRVGVPPRLPRARLAWARSRAARVPPVAAMIFSLPGAPRAAGRRRARVLAAVRRSPARGAPRRRHRPCAGCRCNETLALNPTSAGSAISSTVLSFRAKGAIVSRQGAAARLPLYLYARVARALRPRTCFGLADLRLAGDCNLARDASGAAGGRTTPRGGALSRAREVSFRCRGPRV